MKDEGGPNKKENLKFPWGLKGSYLPNSQGTESSEENHEAEATGLPGVASFCTYRRGLVLPARAAQEDAPSTSRRTADWPHI